MVTEYSSSSLSLWSSFRIHPSIWGCIFFLFFLLIYLRLFLSFAAKEPEVQCINGAWTLKIGDVWRIYILLFLILQFCM